VSDLQQLYTQALTAQQQGRLAEAEALYRQLLAQAQVPEALVNLGNVLNRQGRKAEALASFDQALAARGDFFEALFNRGNLLLEMCRHTEALTDFERASRLRGDVPGVWNNRGTALRALRLLDDALASYDRAVQLQPGHVNALTNRAIILHETKQLDAAMAATDAALAAQPGFAEALYVKGNILRDQGRLQEALENHEAARIAAPDHPHALNGIAQAALVLCDWERTVALAPQLAENVQAGRAVIQPFVMMGYSDDAALLRRCAENYVRRTVPPAPPMASAPYSHDRIRLAYLSADFHQHPTAQLMAELFERHDRDRFEVHAYAFGPDDGSPMRARLKKAFDRFEDVRGLDDRAVAALLREREIDIAVDLNTHTQDARPGIFAHRPAPVQVNYLVYPGTSGAPFMDIVLADRIVLPADRQPFFSEKIVHLPDCYQANDATRIVGPAPSRGAAGLPESGFVFCCFNNSWKITAPMFDIWMRLLKRVDDGVLWLLDSPARENLRREAQARGVGPERLVFAPKVAADEHLARHRLADLVLDTLPYNAHTTASDALWAGVPVVTAIGEAFQGRVAASLLNAIGLSELVTATPAKYEDLALELATNPALLAATREKLARNRTTAPLFDSERFRKAIEAAYEAMLA